MSAPFEKLTDLPDSSGPWDLIEPDGSVSRWQVHIRHDWPAPGMSHPFARNDEQIDPCGWLTGEGSQWRKVSTP